MKEINMNRNFAHRSLMQRLVLVMLATVGSISTFALIVVVPLAASGGLA